MGSTVSAVQSTSVRISQADAMQLINGKKYFFNKRTNIKLETTGISLCFLCVILSGPYVSSSDPDDIGKDRELEAATRGGFLCTPRFCAYL